MGRQVGHYECLKRISSTPRAEVWMGRGVSVAARHKALAIKILRPIPQPNDGWRDALLDRARLSILLCHSNIAQVFDVISDGDSLCVVTEWIDGLTLAKLCARAWGANTMLPAPLAAYVIGEIAQALAYTHALKYEGAPLGLAHGALTPQSVLVSMSGEVKLTGFALTHAVRELEEPPMREDELRFMPPEGSQGQGPDPGSDLYALGAMLHEMLDGRPWRGDGDPADLGTRVASGEVPALDRTDVPAELDAIRLALLRPDREDRMPSAQSVLTALAAWPGYKNAASELGTICRDFVPLGRGRP